MSKLVVGFILLINVICLSGCSKKDAAFYANHPEAALIYALNCSKLTNKEVLKNKTCMAIAEYEKPMCQREVELKGFVVSPSGGYASCEDPFYLISRPVREARLKAYLEGKPDPYIEYEKTHS